MTYIPKHLQEAFRFTDKILQNPEVTKAINRNKGTADFASSSMVKEVTSTTMDLVNKASEKHFELRGFKGVDELWMHHSKELREEFRGKTDEQIKKILSETGAAHFDTSGYLLINPDKAINWNNSSHDLDVKMCVLHELTHAVDNHNASNLFEQAIYLEEGQHLKRLSATDLQNALNMIYIEEHAHGKSIRALKKNVKGRKGNDKIIMEAVLKRHLDALKEYKDRKKAVIQELKGRQGKGSGVTHNSKNGISHPLKWIAGGLGLAGLGALGWHWFKPKASETATSPEAIPTVSTGNPNFSQPSVPLEIPKPMMLTPNETQT